MTQEEFVIEAEKYMQAVVEECRYDLEKAVAVLKERLSKSQEGTLGFALNFAACELVKPMKEYWAG